MNDPQNQKPADNGVGSTGGSAQIRFRRRFDTDELCSVEYRGHQIDCTRHWRHRHVWTCTVTNKDGELVAEHRHEGYDRREMLLESARKAELLPNK